ncbi:MAG: bifunctional salicylyl-CoA 5-hydroxylase/oxidoreductase [Alphaproteobacteria bacterium]|nr:bifunctional salicylyl-CoA 5-hydroxylase/oxidoreductase [Alphaproteobacteria bacterium]MBU0795213.1 bifunctional salicylyl-CoA 5-hydroxylase/oxidoreductase [Alphaproteobacteria bacterium]MBU0876655.1 bifunctional salicylyl-CoA 5-hydroxylase/oxidoreductase [Alphaproteobacteria bacterium]MBU1769357.1 bifunctional salicylyl-CoA 5-hydroxylase/oxidoreductase [Alphaproteobacteria bacterium]
MRIACLGGGPAGLYFAISAKLRDPAHEIHVFERNRAGETFGWGVVFSDQTMANLTSNDPLSADEMLQELAHWDDIEVQVSGRSVISSGHGFIGIGRKRLLDILASRARSLGVILHHESHFDADLARFADFDLVVASDGINSQIRTANAERLGASIEQRTNKFCWLGTTRKFNAFAFLFEQTDAGWIWAHAYRFDETHSTFIVECSPETWRDLGLDKMEQAQSIALCEKIFARQLDGHPLISNASHLRGSAAWINFNRVTCERWSFDNVVLLGDAAHTAHFSIGSGTKLALEDAIALADAIDRPGIEQADVLQQALTDYRDLRQIEVLKIQNSARNSTEWFETLDRYIDFELPQFAYSLMTRSQRVSHENLRLRDPEWLSGVESWFASRAGCGSAAPRPMFTPFKLRDLHLANRVVIPAMLTYSADAQGLATPFHDVHYGARALGGAGLIITETLAVAPEGRVTSACPGLYDDAQVSAWTQIVSFAHQHSKARLCAQLGHAGPRGACHVPNGAEGMAESMDRPLEHGWPLIAASARPWQPGASVPKAASEEDLARICAQFVEATARAEQAGFDMIEIHAGHGSLLASFISPALNHRTDRHGGTLENRLRFVVQVTEAVRAAWPAAKPLAVRISATDWLGDEGTTPDQAVTIARALAGAGADMIDVSAGETSPDAKPVYGRMFQTPLADRIRNETGIPVIAVGNIVEPDQVNSIVTAGRADLVALGRPHLADPVWTLRASVATGDRSQSVPPAYALGFDQARRLAQPNAGRGERP